jgi:hypothetical protein
MPPRLRRLLLPAPQVPAPQVPAPQVPAPQVPPLLLQSCCKAYRTRIADYYRHTKLNSSCAPKSTVLQGGRRQDSHAEQPPVGLVRAHKVRASVTTATRSAATTALDAAQPQGLTSQRLSARPPADLDLRLPSYATLLLNRRLAWAWHKARASSSIALRAAWSPRQSNHSLPSSVHRATCPSRAHRRPRSSCLLSLRRNHRRYWGGRCSEACYKMQWQWRAG